MPAPGLPIKLNERVSLPCLASALTVEGSQGFERQGLPDVLLRSAVPRAVVNPLSLVGGD